MKIALVIPGFQASSQDWCIPVFTDLARELSAQVDLHVFALRYPARRDRYQVGQVRVHALGAGTFRGRRAPVVSMLNLWRAFAAAIAGEHRRSPFGAILGIWATESGWLATQTGRWLSLPSIVHMAGGEVVYFHRIRYGNWNRGLAGWLLRRSVANASIITVPSTPIRRALTLKTNVDPNRIRQWAPGVDTNLFRPMFHAAARRQPFTFVTVGSLIPVKGHDLLLRAISRARTRAPQADIRLRIVGDGPLRIPLEQLAVELDLQGYVTFDGEVEHDALPGVYSSSDAFLLGSWHEAQCLAALEAMSCGLPWVCPPVGVLVDVADREKQIGKSGVLFHTRKADEVARAMLRVATGSNEQYREWGRCAREEVCKNYDMKRQTEKLITLLKELTDS